MAGAMDLASNIMGPAETITGTALGIANMFRKPQSTGYSKDDLAAMAAQRGGQIDQFSNALAASRQKYLNQLPQFQNYAMSRFMPQIEAQMAGRGLQVSGGAFGAALGRQAGDFQAQQMLAAPQMERQDLMAVDQARQNLWGSQFGQQAQNFQQLGDVTGGRLASMSGMLMSHGTAQMQNDSMMRALQQPQGSVVNNANAPFGPGYGNNRLNLPMRGGY